jgi:hypothetical protein
MFLKTKERLKKGLRTLADWLQGLTEDASKQTLTITLIAFCLCCSMLCLFLIVHSIRAPGVRLVIERVRVPTTVNPPASADSLPVQAMRQRVAKISRYVDSLQHSPAGKARYDSLLWIRPHLLDSLHQLQDLFFHPSSIIP